MDTKRFEPLATNHVMPATFAAPAERSPYPRSGKSYGLLQMNADEKRRQAVVNQGPLRFVVLRCTKKSRSTMKTPFYQEKFAGWFGNLAKIQASPS
jgi:hypothetical protein